MSYCTRSDIEDHFGLANVKTWADLDNNQSTVTIAARIARAITYADSIVNGRLRGGPYVLATIEASPPQLLIDAAADLAGVWLYESRGIEDTDFTGTGEQTHKLTPTRNLAIQMLQEIRTGVMRLETDLGSEAHPQVHGDSD